jgi:putative transcriptional regulator
LTTGWISDNYRGVTTYSRQLRRLLAGAKKSQDWLADKMDVDKSTVSRWCSGKKLPRSHHQVELAKLLGSTVDEMLTGKKRAA